MASDLFGNEVGKMYVVNAKDTKIRTPAGNANALNASITYNMPIQPVQVFGSDVIVSLGAPQGQFSFGYLAGTTSITKTSGDNCEGTSMDVLFGFGGKCEVKINGQNRKERKVKMNGARFTGLMIQGQASDYFFAENVTGVFHYLAK